MSLKKNQWRVNCGIVYKDAGEIPFCRIFVHELLTSIAITLKLEYAIVEDFPDSPFLKKNTPKRNLNSVWTFSASVLLNGQKYR